MSLSFHYQLDFCEYSVDVCLFIYFPLLLFIFPSLNYESALVAVYFSDRHCLLSPPSCPAAFIPTLCSAICTCTEPRAYCETCLYLKPLSVRPTLWGLYLRMVRTPLPTPHLSIALNSALSCVYRTTRQWILIPRSFSPFPGATRDGYFDRKKNLYDIIHFIYSNSVVRINRYFCHRRWTEVAFLGAGRIT